MPKRNAVILVADGKVFPPAVFLANRLASLNPRDDTDIIIASDSAKDLEAAKAFGVKARLIPIDPAKTAREFPVRDHFTQAMYYRYYLPSLLRSEYARLIYLDTDIYVENDRLFGLFDVDMAGQSIGGVRDLMVAYWDNNENATERRAIVKGDDPKYLNTGSLLIDVAGFFESDMLRRMVRQLKKGGATLRFPDQSALNLALEGDWCELSPAFNTMLPHWHSYVREVFPPVVIHFTGPTKPWHGPRFAGEHPVRQEMEQFLAATPWRGFLAQHYSFNDAWKAISQPAGKVSLRMQPMTDPVARRVAHYLRETRFADVEAGLISPHLDRIPAGI